jgi:hypothetical protein
VSVVANLCRATPAQCNRLDLLWLTNNPSRNKTWIAGPIVGGVVGLALISALVFFLMRRRRANSQSHTYQVAQQTPAWSPQQGGGDGFITSLRPPTSYQGADDKMSQATTYLDGKDRVSQTTRSNTDSAMYGAGGTGVVGPSVQDLPELVQNNRR